MRRTESFALDARVIVGDRVIVVDCIQHIAIIIATAVLQIVHCVVGFGLRGSCRTLEFVVQQTDVGAAAIATCIIHRRIDITKFFTIG